MDGRQADIADMQDCAVMEQRSHLGGGRGLAVVAGLIAVIGGCGGDDDGSGGGPAPADLDGRTFMATSVSGAELAPTGTLVMAFADGRVAITGGCNGMSASYEIEESILATGDDFEQTAMACDQPLMDQDAWVAGLVGGRPIVTLAGDDLTLSAGGVTVQLVREVALS